VAEVCDDDGNSIIVHAAVEPNTQSDSRMPEEYMGQLPDDGVKKLFIVDGAYNSDSLGAITEAKNVEIQTTSLTDKALEDIATNFILNEKNRSTIRTSGKAVARAKQTRHFSTEKGKKNACRRYGVEGIMSVMRRKYDLDHIPVFGLDRLKSWI